MGTPINSTYMQLTTVNGGASDTTLVQQGVIRQILCKPTTSTTQYDIKITNDQSINVYERTSEAGTLAEEVAIPVLGRYTVALINATRDELFTIQLIIQD